MRLPILLAFVLAFSALAVPCNADDKTHHGEPAAGARETEPDALVQARKAGRRILVIDVRDPEEFAAGHAPDAINIPLARLAAKMKELQIPKTTELVTMCTRGNRSSRAAVQLEKMGYKVTSYCTLEKWKKSGGAIEKSPAPARPARSGAAKDK